MRSVSSAVGSCDYGRYDSMEGFGGVKGWWVVRGFQISLIVWRCEIYQLSTECGVIHHLYTGPASCLLDSNVLCSYFVPSGCCCCCFSLDFASRASRVRQRKKNSIFHLTQPTHPTRRSYSSNNTSPSSQAISAQACSPSPTSTSTLHPSIHAHALLLNYRVCPSPHSRSFSTCCCFLSS